MCSRWQIIKEEACRSPSIGRADLHIFCRALDRTPCRAQSRHGAPSWRVSRGVPRSSGAAPHDCSAQRSHSNKQNLSKASPRRTEERSVGKERTGREEPGERRRIKKKKTIK